MTLEPFDHPPLIDTFFALTDIGGGRQNNEDFFLIDQTLDLYMLADGIGGHAYGEVAAELACQTALEKYKQIKALSPVKDLETAIAALKFAIYAAHRAIHQKGIDNSLYRGMGTTFILFTRFENQILIAHVGDSRGYEYHQDLKQLTEDHVCFASNPKKNQSLRSKHYLTRSLGIYDTVQPEVKIFPLNEKSTFLLCTDGLSDYLSKEALKNHLASAAPLEEIGKNLLNDALANQAKDNVTFILIRPQFQRSQSLC